MTTMFQNSRSSRSIALASIVLALSACSSDQTSPAESPLAPSGTQTGTQGDTITRPSGGAVAGIHISPQRLTMYVGNTSGLGVYPVDANGIPSFALLATKPTWAVANSAVASVTSDGMLRGNSAGITKVYAVVGAMKDSSTVEVVMGRDTTIVVDTTRTGGNPPPPTPPSTPVSSFTLTTYVFGRATPVSPRDSALVVQIAGATVSVYKLSKDASSPSDSLSVRTLVKTATADGNGKAVITGLLSGYYTVIATGTYGGAAMEGRSDFGPPYLADFPIAIYTIRK